MRLKPRIYTGVSAGFYPWIPVDHFASTQIYSYNVFQTGNGDASFQIQYTLNEVQRTIPGELVVPVTALDGFSVNTSALATAVAGYRNALAAFRLRVLSVSGVANAIFTIREGGPTS